MNYNLITILGPTATGKTRLAVKLADYFNGEIISADSRQVYRGMDLGTGKDLKDYEINGNFISYYMIDIINPDEEFSLYHFKVNFQKYFEEITARKKKPFLVGGTPLYLNSILQDYQFEEVNFKSDEYEKLKSVNEDELKKMLLKLKPDQHNVTDLFEKERIIKAILVAQKSRKKKSKKRINSFVIGINIEKDLLKKRIKERLKLRFDEGMIDEVKELVRKGLTYEKLDYFGLEYRYISLYLKGELNYNDMFQKLNSAINNFAKRQMTWYRKMEREGIVINWINPDDYEKAVALINKALNK